MIVALLVTIVLILLFGAGVVKGWIANGVGCGCGGLAILAALIWLGSFFGEASSNLLGWAFLAVFGLLALILMFVGPDQSPPIAKGRHPVLPLQTSQHDTQATPQCEGQIFAPAAPESRDLVWGWFEGDIAQRFSPEAQSKARELYVANNVMGLDRFCREELERLES